MERRRTILRSIATTSRRRPKPRLSKARNRRFEESSAKVKYFSKYLKEPKKN